MGKCYLVSLTFTEDEALGSLYLDQCRQDMSYPTNLNSGQMPSNNLQIHRMCKHLKQTLADSESFQKWFLDVAPNTLVFFNSVTTRTQGRGGGGSQACSSKWQAEEDMIRCAICKGQQLTYSCPELNKICTGKKVCPTHCACFIKTPNQRMH